VRPAGPTGHPAPGRARVAHEFSRFVAARDRRGMSFLSDRRVIAIGGGALALVAGLAIAWVILKRSHPSTAAPPAAQGGLVVGSGRGDDAKPDPNRPLR